MGRSCNSEAICTVLRWRSNAYHLTPHQIHLIGSQGFEKRLAQECSGILVRVENLSEEEVQRHVNKFWQDFGLARQADDFTVPSGGLVWLGIS